MTHDTTITREAITRAALRIAPYVRRTPVMEVMVEWAGTPPGALLGGRYMSACAEAASRTRKAREAVRPVAAARGLRARSMVAVFVVFIGGILV